MHRSSDPLPASRICGYAVARELSRDRTWLAKEGSDRQVVLKILEADCLLKGQLHPSIKERLSRVRELAHLQVANLHGVEREAGQAYLVWEYAAGTTWEDHAETARSVRELLVLARELVLAVEALHAQGIVHGALHGRNVILGPDCKLRLTHVSPLLYNDQAEDAMAVVELLRLTAAKLGHDDSELGGLLNEAATTAMPLRQLRPRIVAILESREVQDARPPTRMDSESGIQKRTLYAAAFTAGAGALVAAGVWWSVQRSAPRPPAPLDAGQAGLQTRAVK